MKGKGLYQKYFVKRTDGKDEPSGPKAGAEYFVLDVTHDLHARPAMRAYIDSLRKDHGYEKLADELEAYYLKGI